MRLKAPFQAVCLDWGGTLMSEQGPQDTSMTPCSFGMPAVWLHAGSADAASALAVPEGSGLEKLAEGVMAAAV